MKELALFSETESSNYSITRFQEESSKLGLQFEHIKYSDVTFRFDKNGTTIWNGDIEITNKYDYFIFRSTNDKSGNSYKQTSETIKRIVFEKGKRILNFNSECRNIFGNSPKIEAYRILSENNIPIIPSFNFPNIEKLNHFVTDFKFPLILKKVNESHGRGIHLINSKEELIKALKRDHVSKYMVQDYIRSTTEFKEDLRIITVGKKVVGAYKKLAPRNSIITNIASGGNAVPIELTSDIITLGEQVIKAMKFEFMGIDAIYNQDGELLVLEVNRAPQFEGFEKATGVNIPREVLNYLLGSTPS